MTNRPFLSDSTKIYDESCFTSAPAQFGQNHLLVTYGQQRRTFDTTTTSITGQQPYQNLNLPFFENRQQFTNDSQNVLNPMKQTYPNCVCYSFPGQDQSTSANFNKLGIDFNGPNEHCIQSNPNQYQSLNNQSQSLYQNQLLNQNQLNQNQINQNQINQNQINQNQINQNQFQQLQFQNQIPPPPLNLTLEQQIALNELQKHALETMLLHEVLKKNPFKLKFHFDGQTDTNDLYYNNNTNNVNNVNVQKPEGLYSEAARRKHLEIKSLPDCEGNVQNPDGNSELNKSNDCDCDDPEKGFKKGSETVSQSVEVQCDARNADGCSCTCGLCEKCEKGMQTERRVSFEKETDVGTKKKRKKKDVICRSVNDDSDSSSAYEDLFFC